MKIQTIFEALEQFKLGHDSPAKLLSWAETGLQRVKYPVIVTYCQIWLEHAYLGDYIMWKCERGFLLKIDLCPCYNYPISGRSRRFTEQVQEHPEHRLNPSRSARETNSQTKKKQTRRRDPRSIDHTWISRAWKSQTVRTVAKRFPCC